MSNHVEVHMDTANHAPWVKNGPNPGVIIRHWPFCAN